MFWLFLLCLYLCGIYYLKIKIVEGEDVDLERIWWRVSLKEKNSSNIEFVGISSYSNIIRSQGYHLSLFSLSRRFPFYSFILITNNRWMPISHNCVKIASLVLGKNIGSWKKAGFVVVIIEWKQQLSFFFFKQIVSESDPLWMKKWVLM